MIVIDNPTDMPPATVIDYTEEPMVKASIFTPEEYVGPIMDICTREAWSTLLI